MSEALPRAWRFLAPGPHKWDDWKNQWVSFSNDPNAYVEARKKLKQSARAGVSRFGWSTWESTNLLLNNADAEHLLRNRPGNNTDDFDLDWSVIQKWRNKAMRLKTHIHPGDYIIHINVINQGECLIAQATGTYYFAGENDASCDDFRHCIPVSFICECARPAKRDNNARYSLLRSRSRLERVKKKAARQELQKILSGYQ